ncbi:MAG: hypothetical protein U9R44_06445 [Candidatus Omnitrophota bacterium]|nr:hypothetical protein [Candidatus Omnitrophota bacterium]
MKKIISVILTVLILLPPAGYGESDSHKTWYDQWYSRGYEEGKKAEKYDPGASYKILKTKVISPKHEELRAVAKYQEAEEYLKAAEDGFYSGYRSGYYREKESGLLQILEKQPEKDIRIYNFKFGKMDAGEDIVVTEETTSLEVPATEGRKDYFGYTFDYSDNDVSEKLVVVINLPGPPKRALGPQFYSSTNSVISEHRIKFGNGHFGNKWYFSRDDLTGKFRLNVYIGGKLVKRLWFDAAGERQRVFLSGTEGDNEGIMRICGF